jgi:hypothetical protein
VSHSSHHVPAHKLAGQHSVVPPCVLHSALENIQLVVHFVQVHCQLVGVPSCQELSRCLVRPLLSPCVGDGVALLTPDDLLQLQVHAISQPQPLK